jgi:putative ABC transport system permease protein
MRVLESILHDVRFAVRSLGRTPVFALTASAVLGLGIGANATVFTIVNTLLLKPLPFERADDIVQVKRRTPSGSSGSFAMHDYLALTPQRGALSALAILDVLSAGRYNLITSGVAEPITGCRVSGEFFAVLGVSPVRGRLLTDGDGVPGRAPTAVITHAFWSRRFARDPAIVGRSVTVGGQPYTIVGVAPDAIRAFSAAEIYMSLPVPEASSDRTNSFQVLGRVAHGVSRAQAEAQIDTIARRHAQASAALTNMPRGVVLRSLQEDWVAPIRPALQALVVAVGLVLLVACSNVANLVLARALSRRREIAVMAALGASRRRIVQRSLAESLIAAAAGGGAGLLLAYLGVRALPALSADLPQADRIHIDAYVIAYIAALATLAGILAGLLPALQLAGGNLLHWMKEGSPQVGANAAGHRTRLVLTLSQIAFSTVLLVGAGLLTRSFWNLASVDPGFRVDRLLTMTVSMSPARYPDAARLAAYTDAIASRLEHIPGVVAASSTTALPSEFPIDFPVSAAGRPDQAASAAGRPAELDAMYRAINPHYFAAMEIPLLNGRSFSDGDSAGAAPVIVINQALARAAFSDRSAIGQALIVGSGYLKDARDLRPRTVVGVVGDTREQGLRFAPTMTMYVPVAQAPEAITRLVLEKIPLRWVVRTGGAPVDLVPSIRQAVLAVDPTQPPADFARMSEVLARSIARNRFNMVMLTIFGGLALVLAAVGVYGLTAFAVAQRTREIGIRVSLGASPAQLVRGLVAQSLRLSLAGAAIGTVGAMFLGRFLRGLLFGVASIDGMTIVVVIATMTAVVAAATYLPASRASKLDPMAALRQD